MPYIGLNVSESEYPLWKKAAEKRELKMTQLIRVAVRELIDIEPEKEEAIPEDLEEL